MITVLAFARYRELLRFERIELPLPEPPTISSLLEDPQLAALPGEALLALNREFTGRDATLQDGDEVALMPPVSGG